MKLTIVGSGGMATKYNSASYLIDDNILIDIPNGSCKALRRMDKDIQNIEHVLITHFHGDHYFDLPFYLLAKNKKEKSIANIYTCKKGIKKSKKIFKLAFPNSVKKVNKNMTINYITDVSFKIGNYFIEKILVDHGNLKPAYGYIISDNNFKVGFTGDTSYTDSIKMMAEKCDYLVCDCSFKVGNDKHMGIDNIVEMANNYPNHKFVVSHLSDASKLALKDIKLENIIVPEDGNIIFDN